MNARHLFFISLIVLFPVTAYTGIYKWTDETGKVHYSQNKPAADIKTESLPIAGAKPGYATTDDKPADDAGQKKTEEIQQPAQQPRQEENKPSAREAKAACAAARKNLAQMQSSGRVRQRDKDGNISYLSDQQKQAEIAKAQKTIKNLCK